MRTCTYTRYFINTFALVVPTALLTLMSRSIMTYGFARSDFPGSQFLFMVLIATLVLPNVIITISRYALLSKLSWLGSYIIFYAPAAVGCCSFFVFMMVQFLRGLLRDSDESICIGGCDLFQCSIQVLLPLLEPAPFSAGLFQFLWTQNDFSNINIYINTVSKFPLSLALRVSIGVTPSMEWNQVMLIALVSVILLILLFFAAQKYFMEGIVTSGLKG